MTADLGRELGKQNLLVLQQGQQSGSLRNESTLHSRLVDTSEEESRWCPAWPGNRREDVIQHPDACHIHKTSREDIFLLLYGRTAPWNPESITSTNGAECKAPSPPPRSRCLSVSLCHTSMDCSLHSRLFSRYGEAELT